MLSQSTIAIIKSTVPVLEIHGVAITKRFYEMLFENHPELLHIFNHANQKQGKQQTALANAVYAAAANIDKLESILPVVKGIAHKHRSLGVKPEHYPIVGQHLLAAIKEVLGDAATDEIIQAWADAYGVIASVFIDVEKEMYVDAATQNGGWEGFRLFKVKRKVIESEVITSFYLVPEDGGPIATFEPGQYLSMKIDIPGEEHSHIRQYSLSSIPGLPFYRVSIKREDGMSDRPDGRVSVYLHKTIQPGDVLHISAPAGDFKLHQNDSRPVVLISGGVGLTPMVSMLRTLADTKTNRAVTFIHAAQHSGVHALKAEVEELVSQHPDYSAHWIYNKPSDEDRESKAFHKEGYIDLPWLREIVPVKDAKFYFCGPLPFMKTVNKALKDWEIPSEDIHFEFFGPAGALD
ncbi:NO-inducible flavohemoprotein [Paenibacillus radicis (ex Gao et al. 2016)]|uniref:Flavohemoprotein n=1 Tax=Paenibacillus radicis (ex Gao et al. 2016) TaxID=1737354 RepID=A0A917H6N4_9BACL|nr:NO-inducible flavohemoprotein [Paenibacillus radicis (ex Gao et al. 2016)]GGG69528.1 flavohemoprotein [Paenibacillus radicis (ex Gao et al. 2016)]